MNDGFPLQRWWFRYGFGGAVSGLAWLLSAYVAPMPAAFAAVITAAFWAGTGPAILAVVAGAGLLAFKAGFLQCVIFTVEGSLLCVCSEVGQQAVARANRGEQWHRQLTETAAEGIQVTDAEGTISYANPRIAEILGYSPGQLKGRNAEEFLFPEDLASERIRRGNRREGTREQYDRRLRRKDGSEAWVLVSGSTFIAQTGMPPSTLSMMTDITERKNAERQLRQSEVRFRSLFENVMQGIYQSTPEGRILAANPMLLRMLGLTSEAEFSDVDIAADFYPDPEMRLRLLDQLERDGYLQNVEYRLRRRDGRVIRVVENARVVRGDDGAVLYYEGTLSDITEAAAERESCASDDLGNALTAVSGYARLILDDLPAGHPAHVSALDLLRAVERAAEAARESSSI